MGVKIAYVAASSFTPRPPFSSNESIAAAPVTRSGLTNLIPQSPAKTAANYSPASHLLWYTAFIALRNAEALQTQRRFVQKPTQSLGQKSAPIAAVYCRNQSSLSERIAIGSCLDARSATRKRLRHTEKHRLKFVQDVTRRPVKA